MWHDIAQLAKYPLWFAGHSWAPSLAFPSADAIKCGCTESHSLALK